MRWLPPISFPLLGSACPPDSETTLMRIVSTAIAATLAAALVHPLHAQGPMQVMPSGRGMTQVTLTPVDSAARANSKPSIIKIDFGQPHLRGRKLHTDSLVPYESPWRTGANAATTLTTDVDLVIGGTTIPKGSYVLETFPSRSGWKLLVQRNVEPPPGPPPPYDPKNDLARIDLRQSNLAEPVESLTFWLIPARGEGKPKGELRFAWGNVSLSTDWSVK